MRFRVIACVFGAAAVITAALASAHGADWPFRRKADPESQNTLVQIARSIDDVEDKILDVGTVGIKQPDVWGQARMTQYRRDFETWMKPSNGNDFAAVLSARIARLDGASLQSQTTLGGSLTPVARQGGSSAGGAASAVTSPTVIALPDASGVMKERDAMFDAASKLQATPGITQSPAFSNLPGKQPFNDLDPKYAGKLGIEPTVFLDEKKRYFDHVNEIRRVNLGDDNADSAGYGLYLVRVPVSIQPGEHTVKGFGASLTATARHDFHPDFLENTFRYLVINDLVDQLAPVVYELIRGELVTDEGTDLETRSEKLRDYFEKTRAYALESRKYEAKKKLNDAKQNSQERSVQEAAKKLNAQLDPRSPEFLTTRIQKALQSAMDNFTRQTGSIDDRFKTLTRNAYRDEFAKLSSNQADSYKILQEQPPSLPDLKLLKDFPDALAHLATLKQVQPSIAQMRKNLEEGLKDIDDLEKAADNTSRRIEDEFQKLGSPSSVGPKSIGPNPNPMGWFDEIEAKAKLVVNGKLPLDDPAKATDPAARLTAVILKDYVDLMKRIDAAKLVLSKVSTQYKNDKTTWTTAIGEDLQPLSNQLNSLAARSNRGVRPQLAELDIAEQMIKDKLGKYAAFFNSLPVSDFQTDVVQKLLGDVAPLSEAVREEADLAKQSESLKTQADTLKARFEALDKAGKALTDAQTKLAIERVAASAFPTARFGGRIYPVAPSEIDDVFITENIKTLVKKTREATLTVTPRSDDVRNYLRHEIEAAYALLDKYQNLVPLIHGMVKDHEFSRLEKEAFPQLLKSLPGALRGQADEVVPVLCWAVAVECGLLDRQLKDDMKVLMKRQPAACADPEILSFHDAVPSPEAETAFEWYVKNRWPMIVFALDPTVDQQNIADAYSLRRDLQLAVSFAFATGRINMSQLTRFNRKIEQDAETIALNKTVSSFSYGNETFGWRFYPRYQNPPIERNNLQVATNLLWRGGPGRNYQLSNSKIEPGIRELTAVIVMPSFLQNVRFDVTGNWFPLHDPDQMKTHTARMLEQGRRVVELRKALAMAEQCNCYRAEDLERLSIRIDQLESLLPMQTRRTQVPYENTLGGFQLFSQGTLALVPELTGFQGVEFVEEGKPADILVFGRHFSLHESKVVAGGAVLAPSDSDLKATGVELVSREVMHLKLPETVRPTNITVDPTGKLKKCPKAYVEVYIATPTGISNRLLIPFKPEDQPKADTTTAEPAKPADPGYVLLDAEFKIQGRITVDAAATAALTAAAKGAGAAGAAGATDPAVVKAGDTTATATLKNAQGTMPTAKGDVTKTKAFNVDAIDYAKTEEIRIMPTKAPATTTDTVDAEFHFQVDSNVYISVNAPKLPFKTDSYVIDNATMKAMAKDFLEKLNAYGKLPTGGASLAPTLAQTTMIKLSTKDGAIATTYNPLKISVILYQAPPAPTDPSKKTPPQTQNPATSASMAAPASASAPGHGGSAPSQGTTPPVSAPTGTGSGGATPKTATSARFVLPPLPDLPGLDSSLLRTGATGPSTDLPALPRQVKPALFPRPAGR